MVETIQLAAPNCHKSEMHIINKHTMEVIQSGTCYYFRIWIENKGNVRAEQVQVYAAKLLRSHADNTFIEEKKFIPMNLK